MKITRYILFLSTLFLISCGGIENDQESTVPEGVELIEKETFVKVMAEAQIIESHISVLRIYQPYYKDSVNHYYKALFEKYNTSTESYYYSMQEYSKDPVGMHELLTQSIDLLKDMESGLGDVQVPNQSVNALSRQQIGDIVYETPISDLIINGEAIMAEYFIDSLFHYLDSFPEIVTDKGYTMESARFSFVLNTSNKMMFNQMQTYLTNKANKEDELENPVVGE